jgi:hypothetical protein
VLLLAWAWACATPTPTALPTPTAVRVLVTDLTEPLGWELARGWAQAQNNAVAVPLLVPEAEVAAQLAAGPAELALVITPPDGLFVTPVGEVVLEVVVHPANSVGTLSSGQVLALFTGQAADWAGVGGSPGRVLVVAPGATSAGARLFAEQVLGGRETAPGARLAPTWAALRETVAGDAGAIGYLPSAWIDNTVRVLSGPEPARALVVAAAPAEPAGAARDFLVWAQSDR